MAKVLTFLLLLVAFFTAGFQGTKRFNDWKMKQTAFYEEVHFKPTAYPLHDLPFVIVIVGKNNGAWLEKTLHSVFTQNYPHYRLIYIDDGSDDGSYELAHHFLQGRPNVQLVRNPETMGILLSLNQAIQSCEDREIVVVLQGEDQMAHEWVLNRLNQYYAHPDLWLTYGQYVSGPEFRPGICRPFKKGEEPRSAPFFTSHLKTFYAKLFKQIQEEDLKIPIGSDEMAFMIPMLEMGEGHIAYIPDVLCVSMERKKDPEMMVRSEQYIRSLPSYTPLHSLFYEAF